MLHHEITRAGEQLGQSASRERDVDAIGFNFNTVEQGHEHRFDFVRRGGSEVFRELTAAFDQLGGS